MKRTILFAVLLAFGTNVAAKKNDSWVYCETQPTKVFVISSNTKGSELIRIYKDGTYEHLKYTEKASGKELVEKNHGKYVISKAKIIFNQPLQKYFSGKFRYGSFFYNGRLYKNVFDMKFRKKVEVFHRTSNKMYFKPFFMCLNSDEVVYNSESAEQIDLNRLVAYIVIGKTTEEAKLKAIIDLIVRSVEYDYEGLRNHTYANKQNDTKSIIAGKQRIAVCAGYAFVLEELGVIAGLKVENVEGHTKQGFRDLNRKTGYHAWNIAEVDGKKKIYDVTWADKYKTTDPRWIDVDPKVMIGSHFPDVLDNQLLEKPISEVQFLEAPITLPLAGSAKYIDLGIQAHQFSEKNYTLVIPGKHNVSVSSVPTEATKLVYNMEANSASLSYSFRDVGVVHFDGKNTIYSIELKEPINALQINIDGKLEIKTFVYRGNKTDLMKYYLTSADKKHIDSYAKGIISAIALNDLKKIKELVGEKNTVFFDSKGKLKINKDFLSTCQEWEGHLSSLYVGTHFQKKDEGLTKEQIMYIEIPNKTRLNLAFDGTEYSIVDLEQLNVFYSFK